MNKNNTYGLKKFGFISDFAAQLAQFNHMLQGTGKTVTYSEIDSIVDPLQPLNLNSFGCDNYYRKPVDEEHAAYKLINTGVHTCSGEEIVGLFTRNRKKNSYEGVKWTTRRGVMTEVTLARKPHMGDFYFESEDALSAFLESVAVCAVPEPWDFTNGKTSCKYPILKSYLENIFGKLRREAAEGAGGKIVYSSDGQHILFNTNLPDTFGNDILIIADVRVKLNGEEYFENPVMFKTGIGGLRQYRFIKGEMPEPATFFEDVNEVIFQSSWPIDTNFEHLFHIIQDNRSRFPKGYQEKDPSVVARDLEKAIDMATRMAKRNFKYIAPMYRPQKDIIQLLMPIYLSGSFSKEPDFALVLTPEDGYYLPETILPIEGAYQNARLIAMPDETWLKPETIFKVRDAA